MQPSSSSDRPLRPYYLPAVASILIASCLLLLWFAFKVTNEWDRSMQLLMQQRASQAMTLMIMAFGRDMRGVQSQILPQLESFDILSARNALANEIAVAFSRFPYPESFFSWTADGTSDGILYVFNRSDRPPPWNPAHPEGTPFPVTVVERPEVMRPLLDVVRSRSSLVKPIVVFETDIGAERYQVIARLRYGGPSDTSLQSVIGFTVNINWVRRHYFSELTSQLSTILAGQVNTSLSVLDENGTVVTTNRRHDSARRVSQPAVYEERFPLLFFEPTFRATAPEGALPERYWTARAEAIIDESLLPALGGARRTFLLISVATAVAVIALIATIRAVRAAALLATMKSEFVSAVTHELKTPLSSIQLASETLVKRRVSSQDAAAQYAGLLLNAVSRLNRTVDNLLSMARIHDVQGFYNFESLDLITILEQVLDRFQAQLKELGFEVEMDVPTSLPAVRADRSAVIQVLDNVIDNAVRYSNGTRYVGISAFAAATHVTVRIIDRGSGIPQDEVPHVFEKFYRGRDTSTAGSGLGLAIAHRVVKDHGGTIRLESQHGFGTTVEISLPSHSEEEPRQ